MVKRISIVLLSTGVGAILMLFVATEAVADFEDCTDFLVFLQGGACTPSTNTDNAGFETCVFDVLGGTKSLSKLSQIEFAVDKRLTIRKTNAGDTIDIQGGVNEGHGGTAGVHYGDQIPNVTVIISPPQSGVPLSFDVLGAGGETGLIGVHTHAGKSDDFCTSQGPVPAVRPLGSFSAAQCLDVDGTLTLAFTRLGDGCSVDASEVRAWLNNPTCDPTTPAPAVELARSIVADDPTFICSGLDASGCPQCITVSTGSPVTVEYSLPSGDKVTFCYDLEDHFGDGTFRCE